MRARYATLPLGLGHNKRWGPGAAHAAFWSAELAARPPKPRAIPSRTRCDECGWVDDDKAFAGDDDPEAARCPRCRSSDYHGLEPRLPFEANEAPTRCPRCWSSDCHCLEPLRPFAVGEVPTR